MTKTISKKYLYSNLKSVSDDVMKNGVSYTVVQYSAPAFQIVPLGLPPTKKYSKEDIRAFMFKGKDPSKKNLATTYKKYLYQ